MVIDGIVLAAGALLTFGSFPAISESLRRSAFYLTALAFVVHTFGLIFRMTLESRPPVTNLYSSAIFIGWGAAVLGLVLEKIYKDGIGCVVASFVEAGSNDELRAMGERLRAELGTGVAVLAASLGERTALFAVATDDVISRGVRADAVVREVAALAGGKGGGKPQMAQAGVSEPDRVPAALERVVEIVRPMLASSAA